MSGGAGADIADYSAANAGFNLTLTGGAQTVTVADQGTDSFDGIDGLIGSKFNDTLTGYDGIGVDPDGSVWTNYLDGNAGNDLITGDNLGNVGGNGGDLLFGGDGNDTLIGGGGGLGIVFSAAGSDTTSNVEDQLFGGAGDDRIFGDDTLGTDSLGGRDYIDGGSGNDTIVAGLGADTVLGGDGADRVWGDDLASTLAGGGTDLILTGVGDDTIYGGAGADTIRAGADNDLVFGDDSAGISATGAGDSIDAGDGLDTVIGGLGGDTIDGGAGADLLYGDDTANTASTGGNDSIVGGAGNDTIYGGFGVDTLAGGLDNDLVFGGAGNDLLDGNDGNDTLSGDAGADTLRGGIGNDSLAGGDGNDSLLGDAGQDTIRFGLGDVANGGADQDLFQFNATDTGTGAWVVDGSETTTTGTDQDTLNLSGATSPLTTTLSAIESGSVSGGASGSFSNIENIVGTGGSDSLTAAGLTSNLTATYGASGANGTLSDGTNTLTFSSFEKLTTGSGADTINAAAATSGVNVATGAGNDSIVGGSGADTIDAGTGNDWVDGGAGADVLTGGDGFDTFSVTSGDVITDFNTATGADINDGNSANNDFVDLTGIYNWDNLPKINAARVAAGLTPYASPIAWMQGDQADDGVLDDVSTANGFASNFTLTIQGVAGTALTTDNTGVTCFTRGTLIETDRGAVAIEDLAEGDLVLTRDNGLQPIRWLGQRMLGAADLAANDKLRPIRIRAGALGRGLPTSDLVVSPQHRVLVRSHIAQRMFGAPEVLVAAKQLCQIDGIDIAHDMASVEYFHMLFDRHEVVISNGAETESLFTGPEALKSLGAAAVEEIFAIFPELRDRDHDHDPVAARPLASGRMARKLAVRHAQNGKPLLA